MNALRFAATALAFACLSLLLASSSSAAPADLDRSFGVKGFAAVPGPGRGPLLGEPAARMAIGPKDEIFVLYSSQGQCARPYECTVELTVARYTPDGERDRLYGGGAGPQLVVHQNTAAHEFNLAVGPDGKPVIAGLDETGGLFVARLDGVGSLDGSFAAGGRAGHPAPGADGPARGGLAVAVQPDGRVVVAGEGYATEGRGNLHVTRYLADGQFDTSFGGRGEVVLGLGTKSLPAGVVVGADGSITVPAPLCCVGGSLAFGGGFSIARLTADGLPVSGWGAGHLFFATPGAQGNVEAVAAAPDGGLVLSFEEEGGPTSTVGNLIKIRPDGSFDPRFGGTGRIRRFSRVGAISPDDLTVDASGRVVGVGWIGGTALFRLRPDGSTDRTFNGGQRLLLPSGATHSGSSPYVVGLQSDGGIVALGQRGSEGISLIRLEGGTSRVRCQGRSATIVGTQRADELTGTPRRDVIAALDGDDEVSGLSGADLICGGRGADEIRGGPGRDTVQENLKEIPVVR